MKGYGIPRNTDSGFPDKADLRFYGNSKHKETKGYSARKRRTIRRFWKKRFRLLQKERLKGINDRSYGSEII